MRSENWSIQHLENGLFSGGHVPWKVLNKSHGTPPLENNPNQCTSIGCCPKTVQTGTRTSHFLEQTAWRSDADVAKGTHERDVRRIELQIPLNIVGMMCTMGA